MRRKPPETSSCEELPITPSQCRAARATLHIGLRELATLARLSAMTISRFENGHATVTVEAVLAIRNALELAGARKDHEPRNKKR